MKHMVDRNPHTGAQMMTKPASDAYRDNYDAIFRRTYQKGNETFEDTVDRIVDTLKAQPGSGEDDKSNSEGAS